MSWNDVNVARLRELWDQGLPTAQIGKLIGFTKNAVVGKAHRIGLERRPSPIRRTAVKPDRKKARSPMMPKLNFENHENKKEESNGSIFQPLPKNTFLSNKNRGCEWPIGHPEEQDFHFCSKERFGDKSYCLEHCAIAYVLPEEKEEKRTSVSQVA